MTKEDPRKIFRNWTWKKFICNTVFFAIIFFTFGIGLELLMTLKEGNFNISKLLIEGLIQSVFLGATITFFSNETEGICSKLLNKIRKKNDTRIK